MARSAAATSDRWLIAAAATVVMLCLGTVYSWSLFTQPLIFGLHLSAVDAGWPFALAIFSLGIGAVVGGRWQDRVGPRVVAVTASSRARPARTTRARARARSCRSP